MEDRRYAVRFLSLFEEDLSDIVDYITYRLKNPGAARHLVDEIEAAIFNRSDCAESFEPYPSERSGNIRTTESMWVTMWFIMW